MLGRFSMVLKKLEKLNTRIDEVGKFFILLFVRWQP